MWIIEMFSLAAPVHRGRGRVPLPCSTSHTFYFIVALMSIIKYNTQYTYYKQNNTKSRTPRLRLGETVRLRLRLTTNDCDCSLCPPALPAHSNCLPAALHCPLAPRAQRRRGTMTRSRCGSSSRITPAIRRSLPAVAAAQDGVPGDAAFGWDW